MNTKNKSKAPKYSRALRLRNGMIAIFCVFLLLIGRLFWLQFIKGPWLKEQMYSQLITSRAISPKRGTIYDTNGKELAISAAVDTVTINPDLIKVSEENKELEEIKTKALKEKVAKAFSEIFELDYEKTLAKVNSTSWLETIVSKVQKDKIDKLKKWMEEEKIYSGINIDEDTKRYYPYNNLASNLIGFCGDENRGLEGLENEFDSLLTGTPGRIITSQDAIQEFIPDQNETLFVAENGNNITLTLDVNIQAIAEKYLEQACKENNCARGGNVIIMNPNNGDILAMATYPNYNLNTPYKVTSITEDKWKEMTSEQKSNAMYSMWRNRALSDRYEPGSVFKVITAAIGLEENLVSPDEKNVFDCPGYHVVAGNTIYCWKGIPGHGKQSLRDALCNSCNPAFMELGEKIGAKTLYKYFEAFGLFDSTNLTSGDVSGNFWDLEDVGPVELATSSFGQRFGITPLQMATAICCIANDGVLVQPKIIKQVTNTDTGATTNIDTTVIRQVVSKETSENLLNMMESVVTSGTGRYGRVTGYSVAGKTGTSEPSPGAEEDGYVASYIAISPVESPEVVALVTLYAPEGDSHQGGQIAGPVASQILTEVLPYLQIPSDSSGSTTGSSSSNSTTTLPNVVNKTIAEANKIIENAGFNCIISGGSEEIVTEQMPKAGTQLLKDSIVKIYSARHEARVSQTVPDLKGKSLSEARTILKDRNLNIQVSGSGIVISQDPIAGTSVEEGTLIAVSMKPEIQDAH